MNIIEEKLITRYIIRHYPVIKIKDKKRFKRGVELIKTTNGETTTDKLFLKESSNANKIREHIIKDVSLVFGFKRDKIKDVITNYIYRG